MRSGLEVRGAGAGKNSQTPAGAGRTVGIGSGFSGSGSGRVRANNFRVFRAKFGFIFCSSRNVLRISLEEIGKS